MPTPAAAVLRELERLGTEQNVKIHRRHGAGEDVYGVSFADLRRLGKRLAPDHALALEQTPAAAPYIERALARKKTPATA